MVPEIKRNLLFLIETLSNLDVVLVYLIQNDIITENECEEVEAEKTSFNKNKKLLLLLQKKDWESNRSIILDILRETNNKSCADKIEGLSSSSSLSNRSLRHPKILKQKWWPEKKILIESLHRRRYQNGDIFLVDELHDRLSKTENKRPIVICESAAASKYSGMGGMGKTLTAKWYANEYEHVYDHVLWMDCGEGSLLKSFERLARDLKIEDRGELDLNEMATKSFDELTAFRCLWIYDNAENYKGKDGIINFLPKSKEYFYCIITSRSRDWGVKDIGFGKISDLELDIFSDEESLDFLKEVLDKKINRTDHLLKELCRSLGNLPLALQLAVATLNCGKINLKSYIEINKFEKVIDAQFDDYERTINSNVKISLELIMKEDGGKEAHEMLLIFGYIRPDDIADEFFKKALGFDDEKVKEVIKILKKYSLASKRKVTIDDQIKIVLSIHRLLQQVIRHNGRWTEEETLRKILGCPGFIDYKLLPFTKYANAKLQKEFPKVKAELLDQEQLLNLIREDRFEESVGLAKFISEELQTNTSKFNYVICLAKNEQLEESVDLLEKLGKEEMKEEGKYGLRNVKMGMLSLENEVSTVSRDLISGHLLVLYGRLRNNERMQELLEKKNLFQFIKSNESVEILIRIIYSDLINSNYFLVCDGHRSTSTFQWGTESKKIELISCSLNLCSFDRLSPTELRLWGVSFTREGQKLEEVTANEFIDLDNINLLTLIGSYLGTKMCIDLIGDVSLEYLELSNVRVLGWRESKWNVQRVKLDTFMEKTEMTIEEMEIYTVESGPSLDISCLPRTLQKLDLKKIEVVCTGEIDLPNLNYLSLKFMDDCSFLSSFHSANITHIDFYGIEEVNVDILPKSVTHIKITKPWTGMTVGGGVSRVNKLILEELTFSEVEKFLSHFQTDELVVHNYEGIPPKELIELTKKEITRLAVGEVEWDEDFSVISSHVDRKADFYLWEGGRGRGIETEEFVELEKLY